MHVFSFSLKKQFFATPLTKCRSNILVINTFSKIYFIHSYWSSRFYVFHELFLVDYLISYTFATSFLLILQYCFAKRPLFHMASVLCVHLFLKQRELHWKECVFYVKLQLSLCIYIIEIFNYSFNHSFTVIYI